MEDSSFLASSLLRPTLARYKGSPNVLAYLRIDVDT